MAIDFSPQLKIKPTDELLKMYEEAYKYRSDMHEALITELNERQIDTKAMVAEKEAKFAANEELLNKGKEGNELYMLLFAGLALLGGLAGIIAGYKYGYSKVVSYSDKVFFAYNERTRKYGRILFWAGLLFAIVTVALKADQYRTR